MPSPAPSAAPYGTWPSPIDADALLVGVPGLSYPRVWDGVLYWLEARPQERGRSVVMRLDADGAARDCVPADANVRSRVHEYAGLCHTVHDGHLYYVEFDDQRIWRLALDDADATPVALTPDDGRRYADLQPDAVRGRLIAVCERHTTGDVHNSLVAVDLHGGEPIELAAGADFYASPSLSPDGAALCWLQWDHPCMPWDGSELRCAAIDATGALSSARVLAGGRDESIFQPGWSPDAPHRPIFVSDASGYWNLCAHDGDGTRRLHAADADFGLPLWQFGMRSWAALADGRIACVRSEDGAMVLGVLDPKSGTLTDLELPWTHFDGLDGGALAAAPARADAASGESAAAHADGTTLYVIAAAPDRFPELVAVDLRAGAVTTRVLRRSRALDLATSELSVGEAITFDSGDAQAHGWFYRPASARATGPTAERPPLLVMSHGGPTAAASNALNLKIQFWTSRGFAVLDVDYRGSTGYGRAYRDALKGGWGVLDVDDCVAGARAVAARGDVDGARMAIRGGSAGGLTVLNALIHHDVFQAGTSLYGVADLAALARDTHKFEARYLDSLVGPWPEAKAIYDARSPVHNAAGLSVPVLFLQGLDDAVVPPSQPEAMLAAMAARGVPRAYIGFEGEQHGFRQAANIRRALEAELYFYGRVFGFAPHDDIDPFEIEDLAR